MKDESKYAEFYPIRLNMLKGYITIKWKCCHYCFYTSFFNTLTEERSLLTCHGGIMTIKIFEALNAAWWPLNNMTSWWCGVEDIRIESSSLGLSHVLSSPAKQLHSVRQAVETTLHEDSLVALAVQHPQPAVRLCCRSNDTDRDSGLRLCQWPRSSGGGVIEKQLKVTHIVCDGCGCTLQDREVQSEEQMVCII